MFATRFITNFKKTCLPAGREKRSRARRLDNIDNVDVVTEQVRQVLGKHGQKLILMVRS